MRRGIEFECIARNNIELAGIMLRNFFERRDGAPVAFDRDYFARAFGQQRAGEPAGAWANFDNRYTVKRSGGARDARGEIEIEQEILTEGFLGGQFVPADDVAQWRQSVGRGHCAASRAA